jgi:hypothetical protein
MPDGTAPTDEQRDAHQDKKDRYHALREVRHTILRLIGDHYRIPEGDHRSWQGCNLDLTGVAIDGNMGFTGAVFSGGRVDFGGATFSGGTVNFRRAAFSNGTVHFHHAVFSGGTVDFEATTGPVPGELLTAVGTPVPSEVRLRADWLFPSPSE